MAINDPRFTDPKLNAIRQALLAGDFATAFSIAPTGWKKATDPAERANFEYWNGNNPMRKMLSIGELRVKDQGGKIVTVPYSQSELENYFTNYHPSKPGFSCSEEQIRKWTKRVLNGNHRYLFPVGIYCKPEKSSRRKKKIKKALKVAAAVGVGVAGAVFLGPAIAGAAGKAGAALGVGAGSIGANSTALISNINNARTVRAVIRGKMPPPPIGLDGQSFRDWAMITAQEKLTQEFQRKLTRQEERELQAEIDAMQRELIRATPRNVLTGQPQPNVSLSPYVRNIQTIEKKKKSELEKYLLPAALVLGALVLGG